MQAEEFLVSGIHVFTVFALCLLHQHTGIWDYRIWSSYLEAPLQFIRFSHILKDIPENLTYTLFIVLSCFSLPSWQFLCFIRIRLCLKWVEQTIEPLVGDFAMN